MDAAGGESGGCDVVAIGVLVAVAAELEPVPELVVAEFVLGGLGDVAGDQAEGCVAALGERFEERHDAGEDAAFVDGEHLGESSDVGRPEILPEFWRRLEAVQREQVGRDGAVAAAGEGYAGGGGVADAVVLVERDDEGGLAGAAGRDECSIDVEKADVHGD